MSHCYYYYYNMGYIYFLHVCLPMMFVCVFIYVCFLVLFYLYGCFILLLVCK